MHNRFHIFNFQFYAIAATVTLLFAACSKDENNHQETAPTLRPLTIEVTETPYVNPDASANAPGNRAAITTTSTLTSFALRYVYGSTVASNDINITKISNGKWSGGSWPDPESTVNWYAKTAGTFSNDGGAHIHFNAITDQKDLLVATASGTYSETGGNLTFNFNHACAALRFYVKKSTNLNDYTLSVSNVRLCNVKKQGDYYYGTSSWSSVETNAEFVLYYGSAKTLGSSVYEALDASDAPYLFLIPQELTAWNGTTDITDLVCSLQFLCKITRNSDSHVMHDGTAYIPFAAVLEKGYQYDVKINIGKNSLYSGPNTKIIN